MGDASSTGLSPPASAPLDAGLDAAIRTFRTAAVLWLAAVTALSYASIQRPVPAMLGVAAAGGITVAWWTGLSSTRRPALVTAELMVGAGLVAADGWVFDDGRAQSFGGVWPLAGVLAMAARAGAGHAGHGGRAGVGAGLLLGAARAAGEVVVVAGPWTATRLLAVASTGVLFALAGWVAGWAGDRIRSAERHAARAEARDDFAAQLHDGVLQTLAVIQRRSDDDGLVRLARTQEAELRGYLAGVDGEHDDAAPVPLEVVLRRVVATATARSGLRVEVAPVAPLPELTPSDAAEVAGAVGECLANVAKHAGVDRAVVFAEADAGTVVVSVTDSGVGFDPVATTVRGLDGSVARRIGRLGGTMSIRSEPGAGTTVTLTVPVVPPGTGPRR